MQTLTPKQQEILDRENRILEIARPMIVREGYHGLNMDRIAEEVQYSKGTIYNHFSCKEEIIIALAIQNAAKRVAMFQNAAQFKGCARHRMVAIGEAAERFVRQFPDFFQFEKILELASVREKTSEKRKSVIRGCEMQCMSVVAGVVRDAVASGDLILKANQTPEQLVFGLWSMTSGAYAIVFSADSLAHVGLGDPFQTVRDSTAALLDGHHWNPLSPEYDQEEILKKIREEVFGDE
ncbi:MAG: TetR/AcrR family transcriptional regulator [Mariniblastus sp.]